MAADPKVPVNFRTSAPAKMWLEEVAEAHRVDRSEVIRCGLLLARKYSKELDELIEARR